MNGSIMDLITLINDKVGNSDDEFENLRYMAKNCFGTYEKILSIIKDDCNSSYPEGSDAWLLERNILIIVFMIIIHNVQEYMNPKFEYHKNKVRLVYNALNLSVREVKVFKLKKSVNLSNIDQCEDFYMEAVYPWVRYLVKNKAYNPVIKVKYDNHYNFNFDIRDNDAEEDMLSDALEYFKLVNTGNDHAFRDAVKDCNTITFTTSSTWENGPARLHEPIYLKE